MKLSWRRLDLEMRKANLVAGFFLLCSVVFSETALGQATKNQYVADFGAAFTQATVTKARGGFVGLDLQAGKMLTSNISLGLATGCDVVSLRKIGDVYERLSIIPVLAKAKMYFTIAPMMQLYASAAGGVYQSVPHLNTEPIGEIWNADASPGGSLGIGFNYWLLGTQGLGAEFEYNFFDGGGENMFSYFAVRLNYSIIKM